MKNIDIKTEGTKLIITIDLSKTFGASKSGKSIVIASTEGNKLFAPGMFVGVNVYRIAN